MRAKVPLFKVWKCLDILSDTTPVVLHMYKKKKKGAVKQKEQRGANKKKEKRLELGCIFFVEQCPGCGSIHVGLTGKIDIGFWIMGGIADTPETVE